MARIKEWAKHVVSCGVVLTDAGSINWVAFTRKSEVKHGAHIGEASLLGQRALVTPRGRKRANFRPAL